MISLRRGNAIKTTTITNDGRIWITLLFITRHQSPYSLPSRAKRRAIGLRQGLVDHNTMSQQQQQQRRSRSSGSRRSWLLLLIAYSLLLRVSATTDVNFWRSTPATTASSLASSPIVQQEKKKNGSFWRLRPSSVSFMSSSSAKYLRLRGGSSPRFPPSVVPSQESSSRRERLGGSRQFQSRRGGIELGAVEEDEQEDFASTKELIDAFLTRDSRNSFIGTSIQRGGEPYNSCRSFEKTKKEELRLIHCTFVSSHATISSGLCHLIGPVDLHCFSRRPIWRLPPFDQYPYNVRCHQPPLALRIWGDPP
jgi:hypothetical protein